MALFEGFVNPALVAGTALAAVPLVIHLLNRQRHRPQQWAAMRFVLAAYKKTRRRVQLEDLLLLLLRMAAVAALAMAVSRPFTGSESPLASLTESRRDVAIVIDASASTGYRRDVDTVFERIIDRTRELVGELDGNRGDRAHLILAGAWPRLIAWGEPRNAISALDGVHEPTDERLDLAAALSEVLDFAREEAASTEESRVQVHVLTDLQRDVFHGSAPAADAEAGASRGLFEVLEEFKTLNVTVQVEDLAPGPPVPSNLAIVEVDVEGPLVGEGTPVDLRVSVANHGQDPKAALRVALEVDGVRRPSQVIDLDPLSSGDAIFPLVFDKSGDHVVRALLEGDRLAADDSRVKIVHVPEPIRILVVNGAPAAEIERDAAARLFIVLEPLMGEDAEFASRSPFDPVEARPRDLESGDVELAAFDVVWLANVDSLSPDAVERLEEYVAAGASLIMSLGDRVQIDPFNSRFFRADGSGLSPAELDARIAVASRRDSFFRIGEFDEQHPALRLFGEKRWKPLFTEAPFYEFVAARPLESTEVLANLDDPARSPLLLSRDYDRGTVYLWTSTIDESWTAFPTWGPALVPFVYDLVRHAGTGEAPVSALAPGASFVAEVSSFPRSMELVLPNDTRKTLDAEPTELAHNRWRLPAIEATDTASAGLYRVVTEAAGELAFAVEIEPEESDLARLGTGELEDLHPALALFVAGEGGTQVDDLPERGELWRWLALTALFAVIGESLWSAWIGRRRRSS